MNIFDTINNLLFGTERVKASKSECKTKKEKAKNDYDAVMKQIETDCEASLTKAKEDDKSAIPQPAPSVVPKPVVSTSNSGFFSSSNEPKAPEQPTRMGGKSKKRPKSNRKKTKRKH